MAAEPEAADTPLARCPICGRVLSNPRRAKTLYSLRVCKKCQHGFANRRQLGYVVDALLWMIPATGVGYVLGMLAGAAPRTAAPSLSSIWLTMFGFDSVDRFIMVWIFPLLFLCKDGFSGMSLGKWLMGVQVVDRGTMEPISFGQSFKRNLVLMIPFAVLYVALTMLKGARAGDRWANTIVVLRKHAHKPPFDMRGHFCFNCGYDLTGNVSGRCPECGTPLPTDSAAHG